MSMHAQPEKVLLSLPGIFAFTNVQPGVYSGQSTATDCVHM